MVEGMKKATIKSVPAAQLLKAMGISKKRQDEILKRYAAARKRALGKEAVEKPLPAPSEHAPAA